MKNVLIGLSTGIICGLFSSGGGLLLVPMLVYFSKLDEKRARATSVFCILPMVLVTAILYEKNNYINWNVGVKSAIGGIIGGFIGGKLLNKIKTKYLQLLFIIFLFYAGFNLIIK